MNKQIIATSAGFSISPRSKKIDRYILDQARSARPKICFVPTASGDAKGYIQRFYKFFNKENCQPDHLPLFKGKTNQLHSFILSQDILYVGGGNTRNMLALWRLWGVDKSITEAYQNGVVLCGISAGSLCWFEQGLTDSYPGQLVPIDGLGFVKGSNCPFFDGDMRKKKIYPKLIQSGKMKSGIATELGVGLHYMEGVLHRVITSKPNANAYKYTLNHAVVRQHKITAELL